MSDLKVRKKIRMENYDYGNNGLYFITICVKNFECILCGIEENKNLRNFNVGANSVRPSYINVLNDYGKIVETSIKNIPKFYENIFVDNYVVMPNHIHIIIRICREDGRTLFAPTISRIIKHMKEYVTKSIGFSIFQRSYYDNIIKNDKMYDKIYNYIENNPSKWSEDKYNPENFKEIKIITK